MRLASLIRRTEAAQVAEEDVDVVLSWSKDWTWRLSRKNMELREGRQLKHSNICVWYCIEIKMVTSTSIILQPRLEVPQLDSLILLHGENHVPNVRTRYPQAQRALFSYVDICDQKW